MSKYYIEFTKKIYGEVILDSRSYQFYLFLSPDYFPDDQQIGYLDRVYKNVIREYVHFDYYILKNKRGVFKQGYALKLDGIAATNLGKAKPTDRTFGWHSIIDDYKNKISESKFKKDKIETVIILWYSELSQKLKDRVHVASQDLRSCVCKRILIEGKGEPHYEYYQVPDERNPEIHYIPKRLEKIEPEEQDIHVFPYSKEMLNNINGIIQELTEANEKKKKLLESWGHLDF